MEIKDLLKENEHRTYRFADGFTNSVMERIASSTPILVMWQKRAIQIAAACAILVCAFLQTMEGSISLDAMLGISSYNDAEISATENLYNLWDQIEIN